MIIAYLNINALDLADLLALVIMALTLITAFCLVGILLAIR